MSHIEENNLTERQAEWLAILKACQSSGKSMAAYARDNDLVVKDLYTWKTVLVTKGILSRTDSVGFVKAMIKKPVSHAGEYRVELPNGITVVMPGVADEAGLMNLLRSVMQL